MDDTTNITVNYTDNATLSNANDTTQITVNQTGNATLSNANDTTNIYHLPFHLFYFLMPPAAIVYHYELIRVNGKRELLGF